MQGHADDELQGLGVQQILGQTHRVRPTLLGPQRAPTGGIDPGAKTKTLGVAALGSVSGLCCWRVEVGGPGGTEPGLCLVNGTNSRRADYSLFRSPDTGRQGPWSMAFPLHSLRSANPMWPVRESPLLTRLEAALILLQTS